MGAKAFAYGDHVVGPAGLDLHTAAHEAAHVVQRRRGVLAKSTVGRADGPLERHADRVADAVVAGRSAEALLDAVPDAPAPDIARERTASDDQPRVPGWSYWDFGPDDDAPVDDDTYQWRMTRDLGDAGARYLRIDRGQDAADIEDTLPEDDYMVHLRYNKRSDKSWTREGLAKDKDFVAEARGVIRQRFDVTEKYDGTEAFQRCLGDILDGIFEARPKERRAVNGYKHEKRELAKLGANVVRARASKKKRRKEAATMKAAVATRGLKRKAEAPLTRDTPLKKADRRKKRSLKGKHWEPGEVRHEPLHHGRSDHAGRGATGRQPLGHLRRDAGRPKSPASSSANCSAARPWTTSKTARPTRSSSAGRRHRSMRSATPHSASPATRATSWWVDRASRNTRRSSPS